MSILDTSHNVIPALMSGATILGAVVMNTSWLPGVAEGGICAVVIFALARAKKWAKHWFETLFEQAASTNHKAEIAVKQTTANGLQSESSGDVSKRTENVSAVLFRIIAATTDIEKLPPDLQSAIKELHHRYEEG